MGSSDQNGKRDLSPEYRVFKSARDNLRLETVRHVRPLHPAISQHNRMARGLPPRRAADPKEGKK